MLMEVGQAQPPSASTQTRPDEENKRLARAREIEARALERARER
jgi:hypothetical protein